jgi:hypothetical protein
MKIARFKTKILLILLFPIILLIKEILYLNPALTENLYSRLFFPPIGMFLSKLSGFLPISFAEFLVYALVAASVYLLIRLLVRFIKSRNKLETSLNAIINGLCTLSIVYCLFLLLWGFNYYRQPLAYSIGYTTSKSTVADLKGLCTILIDKTNQLRTEVRENEEGIMVLDGGFKSAVRRADIGYQNLSKTFTTFKGSYGIPKGITFSRQFCYTGIAGIYFPFTGEANVNKLMPDFMLPSTISHEMAHQRGFAREDEANFIAYLVCKAQDDVDFQYSGYLLAMIYSMNAIHDYDIESYNELAVKYDEGVRRDLKYYSDFWKQFEGPVEEFQEKVNDTYLKSNKQADGIYSYGRMVDLLLAEYRNK